MKRRPFLPLLLVLALLAPTLVHGAEKPLSDDALHDMVKRRLANDAVVKGGALEIEVKDGTVTLRGEVELAKQKEKAEKVAKKVKGVKQVVNELRVTRR
jgi:osmotically-inducible protein OsmY